MKSRLTVAISPADVGSRVSVRSRIPGAAPGAPTMTDAVGELLAWTGSELRIQRRDGSVAVVRVVDLLAGKVLPHPPPQRGGRYPA